MKFISIALASVLSLGLITGCGGGSSEPKPGDLDYVVSTICMPDRIANADLVPDFGCVKTVAGATYSFVCKAGQGLNVLEGSNKKIQEILLGTRYMGYTTIDGTRFSCMSGKY